jgi:hypothetical protein
MKLIGRAGVVLAAIAVFGLGFESYWTASAQECTADEGRSYSPSVSVHPNERDMVFSECGNLPGNESGCFVLKFNREAKTLGRYALPGEYNYENPSFSPSGNWIVAERRPKLSTVPDESQWQEIYRQSEIVMFRVDGSEFTVLPLAPGYKAAPVMSPDEKYVAFRRGEVLPRTSRFMAMDGDAWEVKLVDGKESLFAANFRFLQMWGMQYVDSDTLLVNAGSPYAIAPDNPAEAATAIPAYEKQSRRSQIYRLRRGDRILVVPLQTGFDSAQRASMDRAGNLYFDGSGQLELLHRLSPAGKLMHRTLPVEMVNQIISMNSTPSGNYLACVLACGPRSRGIRKIALLDFETNIFAPVTIPPLNSSYQIAIAPTR